MKQQIEKLLTEFRLNEARQLLMGLELESVPAHERADFAELCRRAGLFRLSMQFMHALVYDSPLASQDDIYEYASGLRRVGLFHEALRLLDRVPPSARVSLQKAFCHINRWDHSAAAGHLLLTLETHPNTNESRTARVNLAASLAALGEFDAAGKWLAQLEPECKQHSFHHFINCREIRAQIQVLKGDFSGAKAILNDSILTFGTSEGPAKLMLRKWEHIIAVAQGPREEARVAMSEFKQQLRAAGHWENLRTCDWELARVTNDSELAAKVYFGTPYPAFRQQVLSSQFGAHIPDHILRTDSRWKGQKPLLINGMTGQNMPSKSGTETYKTALLMLSDNYQPWTPYRLFDGLHPNEDFDPFQSHSRMRDLCTKLEKEMNKKKTPLELRASGQGYRLRPCGNGAVIVFDEMRIAKAKPQKRAAKVKAS